MSLKAGHRNSNLRVCFLDLDGTLWPDDTLGKILSKQVPSSSKMKILKNLRIDFDFIIAVSNQTIFARSKKIAKLQLFRYFWNLAMLQKRFNLDGFLICHHHPFANNPLLQANCINRKPSSEMLHSFGSRFGLDVDKSIFIGDRISDIACANGAGIEQAFLIFNSHSLHKIETNMKWPNHFMFRVINDFEELELSGEKTT
jgi:D-glycero-D-manno-heptose 1,7-bisphosphate phosphatase